MGRPAGKKLGARAGYSVLNGLGITLVCLTGAMAALTWLNPGEAGIAIILWIGIIIAAQAFEVTEKKYYPAVVVGLLPALAAWAMLMVKTSVGAGGATLNAALVSGAQAGGAYLGGGFALEPGFLYSGMVWSAGGVGLIDPRRGPGGR